MEKNPVPTDGPSLNIIFQWMFLLLTFGLAIIVIARDIFVKTTVTDPNDIPTSAFDTISEKLQSDYEFLVFQKDTTDPANPLYYIDKVNGINFTNGLAMEAKGACQIIMNITDSVGAGCEANEDPAYIFTNGDTPPAKYLFYLNGDTGSATVQFPVPGGQCVYTLGCSNASQCDEGKVCSWTNCPP